MTESEEMLIVIIVLATMNIVLLYGSYQVITVMLQKSYPGAYFNDIGWIWIYVLAYVLIILFINLTIIKIIRRVETK